MKEKLIAYYRVSTKRQGVNGLGMDAQRAAVRAFLQSGRRELIEEFAEVESGKRDDRPELEKAIAACRATGSRLVIAKIDRLARNAGFLLNLRDAGVDFVCCDAPFADRFTVGVLALVAERERELISERTKAGLAAAKRRGIRLGNPELAKARMRGAEGTKRRALRFVAKLAPVISDIQERGRITTHLKIAECLNARGFKTPNGKPFTRHAVARLLKRITA
jgi:DNA invertase Pin-like site-specific DNA recombinase